MEIDKLYKISNIFFLILFLLILLDSFDHNLGLIDYKVLHLETGYNFKMFFTVVLSFNFFRLSELHEFIFAYYFLWHSLFLKEKIIIK